MFGSVVAAWPWCSFRGLGIFAGKPWHIDEKTRLYHGCLPIKHGEFLLRYTLKSQKEILSNPGNKFGFTDSYFIFE